VFRDPCFVTRDSWREEDLRRCASREWFGAGKLDSLVDLLFFVSVADKGLTICVCALETYSCGNLCKY
jgi:hypothetical protein